MLGSRRAEHESTLSELLTLQRELSASVRELRSEQAELRRQLAETDRRLTLIGQLTLDDEAATRRLLHQARTSESYAKVYEAAQPLVSICIPTYQNWRGLVERSLPSVLAQDHPRIEVVVIGDAAPPETERAIRELGDNRVRYENLPVRGPYPEEERKLWYVAGTGPLNRAMELAGGHWLATLNDDDAMRPDHVSTLLQAARETRSEVVYGQLEQHAPDGSSEMILAWPPANHAFGWQAAIQHAALSLFEFELSACVFDEPGDWHRARRMLRAGVRFRMIERVVGDYYPSTLWGRS